MNNGGEKVKSDKQSIASFTKAKTTKKQKALGGLHLDLFAPNSSSKTTKHIIRNSKGYANPPVFLPDMSKGKGSAPKSAKSSKTSKKFRSNKPSPRPVSNKPTPLTPTVSPAPTQLDPSSMPVDTEMPSSESESPTLSPPTEPPTGETEAPTADPTDSSPTNEPTTMPTLRPSESLPTTLPSAFPSNTNTPTTTTRPSQTFRPSQTSRPTQQTQAPSLSPTDMPTRSSSPTAPTFNFLDGFDCNDPFFDSLNSDPPNSAYPQFLPINETDPDTLCFLRMTPDDEQTLATSAFLGVPVEDPSNFQFSMSIGYRIYGGDLGSADGMVFVMHQDPRGAQALGNQGGGIGVYGDFPTTIKPAVSIEWDTFFNPQRLDVGQNNVHAILVNPDATLTELGQTRNVPIRTDDSGDTVGRMWVEYNCDNSGLINIWNSNTGTDFRPTFPLLSIPIDLQDVFFQNGDDTLFVGYTSSIGGQADNHDMMGWEFAEGNCGAGSSLSSQQQKQEQPSLSQTTTWTQQRQHHKDLFSNGVKVGI